MFEWKYDVSGRLADVARLAIPWVVEVNIVFMDDTGFKILVNIPKLKFLISQNYSAVN